MDAIVQRPVQSPLWSTAIARLDACQNPLWTGTEDGEVQLAPLSASRPPRIAGGAQCRKHGSRCIQFSGLAIVSAYAEDDIHEEWFVEAFGLACSELRKSRMRYGTSLPKVFRGALCVSRHIKPMGPQYNIQTDVHVCVYTRIDMYISLYIYICVCVYVYIYTRFCTCICRVQGQAATQHTDLRGWLDCRLLSEVLLLHFPA